PLVSRCLRLPKNNKKDLCALSSLSLVEDMKQETVELPNETLEVQLLIWPLDAVATEDPDKFDCARHEVAFDAVGGFPVAQSTTPSPALGGRTFFHPGDEEVLVTLGCTDLPAVNKCELTPTRDVTAGIENFENLGISIPLNEATSFSVVLAEPQFEVAVNSFVLRATGVDELNLQQSGSNPVWKDTFNLAFETAACLQVLQDTAQATASVTCTEENLDATSLNLVGYHLPKATLDQILIALGQLSFPAAGLTVGIVVDRFSNPVAGRVVTPTDGTVRYLSGSRMTFGGTATSASGIFVSTDAGFGTKFRVPGSSTEIGGRIRDKVTVVVLQE
ncbi:MAG TPA: hypothetical protein VK427_23620, partial [Kofleriaceae bacterium]|nr:hypothetical protein [Kofleriaceae bacterium]